MEFTKLNNGVQMPMHGIGTFLLSPDQAEASATYAPVSYTHLTLPTNSRV